MGEPGAGKRSLVDALSSRSGLCRPPTGLVRSQAGLNRSQPDRTPVKSLLDLSPDDVTGLRHHVNVVVLSRDVIDEYTHDLDVNLYVLVTDLTTLEGE